MKILFDLILPLWELLLTFFFLIFVAYLLNLVAIHCFWFDNCHPFPPLATVDSFLNTIYGRGFHLIVCSTPASDRWLEIHQATKRPSDKSLITLQVQFAWCVISASPSDYFCFCIISKYSSFPSYQEELKTTGLKINRQLKLLSYVRTSKTDSNKLLRNLNSQCSPMICLNQSSPGTCNET